MLSWILNLLNNPDQNLNQALQFNLLTITSGGLKIVWNKKNKKTNMRVSQLILLIVARGNFLLSSHTYAHTYTHSFTKSLHIQRIYKLVNF